VAAPEVVGGEGGVGVSHQALVDLLEPFHGQSRAGLTAGAILIGRRTSAGVAALGLGLADGLAAGGAGLGDRPQEGPEGQAQVPEAIAGVRSLVLLRQAPGGNPQGKEQFKLMEGRAEGGAQGRRLI
jgi:hypothetical protein